MGLKYDIVSGDSATVTAALLALESSESSHTLVVLGFDYDGANYHVLVRYET